MVNGVYPKALKDSWEKFDADKGSDNDRPWELLKKTQLYLLMEMENCGEELDSQKLTAKEAVDLFKEVAENLAGAEEKCKFEHRDLHTGNILVKRENGAIKPFIIDFTLSRIQPHNEVISILFTPRITGGTYLYIIRPLI